MEVSSQTTRLPHSEMLLPRQHRPGYINGLLRAFPRWPCNPLNAFSTRWQCPLTIEELRASQEENSECLGFPRENSDPGLCVESWQSHQFPPGKPITGSQTPQHYTHPEGDRGLSIQGRPPRVLSSHWLFLENKTIFRDLKLWEHGGQWHRPWDICKKENMGDRNEYERPQDDGTKRTFRDS